MMNEQYRENSVASNKRQVTYKQALLVSHGLIFLVHIRSLRNFCSWDPSIPMVTPFDVLNLSV